MQTSTGLEFNIDENLWDDMELVDALGELQENPLAISKVILLMFGEEGKKDLYEHCRDPKTGKVSTRLVDKEVSEIFQILSSNIKK